MHRFSISWIIVAIVCAALLASCAGLEPSHPIGRARMGRTASETVASRDGHEPGPLYSESLREKIDDGLRELDGPDPKIPVTLNEEVKDAVDYFLTDARRFMVKSLGRSTRYTGMMRRILREKGLPPDLVYMVLIESGFRVDAISPAKAGGPWQFIPATGKRYGLRINEWVDERMDPVRSTRAAADYLADLHEMFGSWYLAAAAYNCGEGKILKGLKKYNATDFWEISAGGDFLRDETKSYVPKFLAAMIIAKEPARYGLTGIQPEEPMQYDEVAVPEPTDLDVIARLSGISVEDIQELNPHFKLWCTPVGVKDYVVRLPPGSGNVFLANYNSLKPGERLQVSIHTVRSGDRLDALAGMYGLTGDTLKAYNNLKSSRLKRGQKIKIPVGAQVYLTRQKEHEAKQAAEIARLKAQGNHVIYTVKSGDNPWSIARLFDLDWKEIAAWNAIDDVRRLQPGQKLDLYLTSGDEKPQAAASLGQASLKAKAASKPAPPAAPPSLADVSYTVKKGDSLWQIAHNHRVSTADIRGWNKLKDNRIKPGQVLVIKMAGADSKPETAKPAPAEKKPVQAQAAPVEKAASKPEPKPTAEPASAPAPKPSGDRPDTYTVQKDETLYRISLKFKMSPEELKALNGLKNNNIRVGQVLKIKPQATAAPAPAKPETKPAVQVKAASPEKPAASKSTPTAEYKVQPDDTLWKISRRFKVKPQEIRDANNMSGDSIRPGQTLKIPGGAVQTAAAQADPAPKKSIEYTVRDGDTLWKIAQRFNVEPDQIKSWNKLKDNNIRPGLVLTIRPGRS